MLQIQQITSDPNQAQTVILQDGTQLQMSLYYSVGQYGWFMNLQYGSNFTLNGVRVTVSPNILRQWGNELPFGLGCFQTTAPREPTQQQDFSSGLFQLYILSSTEVTEYNQFLSDNNPN